MIGALEKIRKKVGELLSVERMKEIDALLHKAEEQYWRLLSEKSSLEEELSAARAQPVKVCDYADALAQWARTADRREVEKVTQSIAGGVVGACWQIAGEVSKP
jgi:chromosome segregation ATPase